MDEKPTRKQKEALLNAGLNWHNWMFVKETEFSYVFIHKESGRTRRVDKLGKR